MPLMKQKNDIEKKPWITRAILKSIKQKNRLFKIHRCNPNNYNETTYKKYRNKLNSVIRQAKREYHFEKFQEVKHDLKLTWQFINKNIKKK